MIKLSILIPAFNYPEGIECILRVLTPLPPEVQIIIFDDSPGTEIQGIVKQYSLENIFFQMNRPAKGAVSNWNSLLDHAKGEFITLLHHDEIPLGLDFLTRILDTLRHASSDVFMIDVVLLDASMRPIRRHFPPMLRGLLIHYVPGYLFCRNIIGPTAALIVRRTAQPKFDASLKWLVDVDMYYRLRKKCRCWQTIRDIEIGSIQGNHRTITQSLQKDLKQLEQIERARLSEKHPEAAFWINIRQNHFLRALEAGVWGCFRAIQIIASRLRMPEFLIK